MTIKLMKENVNRTKHSYLLGAGFEVGEYLPQPRLTQEKQVKTVRVPIPFGTIIALGVGMGKRCLGSD
jgi:hypothetical protein